MASKINETYLITLSVREVTIIFFNIAKTALKLLSGNVFRFMKSARVTAKPRSKPTFSACFFGFGIWEAEAISWISFFCIWEAEAISWISFCVWKSSSIFFKWSASWGQRASSSSIFRPYSVEGRLKGMDGKWGYGPGHVNVTKHNLLSRLIGFISEYLRIIFGGRKNEVALNYVREVKFRMVIVGFEDLVDVLVIFKTSSIITWHQRTLVMQCTSSAF